MASGLEERRYSWDTRADDQDGSGITATSSRDPGLLTGYQIKTRISIFRRHENRIQELPYASSDVLQQ